MLIHIFHLRSSLHITTLYFTTFHSPFLTSFYFRKFRQHASKTLHFSLLIITFLTLFLKMRDLQEKVASASAGNCPNLGRQNSIYSFFKASRPKLGITHPLTQSAPDLFPRALEGSVQGVKVIAHLHLVLRM
jgi:hypothetical protein